MGAAKFKKATCHPDKPHAGLGLCPACYMRHKRTQGDPSVCHPDRPIYSRGLCNACYQRTTADKPKRAAAERERRKRPGKTHRVAGWKRQGCINPPGEVPDVPCEICGAEGRDLHLDHDHSTGLFRGWLCSNCNCGLGNLKDDVTIMTKAIEYLQRAR